MAQHCRTGITTIPEMLLNPQTSEIVREEAKCKPVKGLSIIDGQCVNQSPVWCSPHHNITAYLETLDSRSQDP
ncbi:hypothetical protein PGT21_020898 [Puccinia graminis f. sp. tritici]|uniref:Uncharacterized protein n=1 Tax=Puccinia graminis f. sp. tritici TaxID=56615 RepID=A0A5B0QN75_PUCGR|nr:hypothetical protein PGT21_020898 [Puccinia graminis f. sp. tritici]